MAQDNLRDTARRGWQQMLRMPCDLHVDPLEKRWMQLAFGMIALFVGIILYSALFGHIHPPGGMEVVDSSSLHLSEEFAEDKLGVRVDEDGAIRATVVAARYGFYPREIRLPAGKPVTFRLASQDVLHGIHIPMTNMGTMIVPGYVSTVTTVFPKPGEYPMLCNEFCGMGHDHMWSKLIVLSDEDWQKEIKQPQGGKSP